MDADLFYDLFAEGGFGKIEAVFHEGARSDTTRPDGKYTMDNNYAVVWFVQRLPAARHAAASTHHPPPRNGGSDTFRETPEFEKPLNVSWLQQAAV